MKTVENIEQEQESESNSVGKIGTVESQQRYIIRNTETEVIDGLYLYLTRAESSAVKLRETWPGLSWEVESSTDPYPPPDRVCTGHVRARKVLKDYQQQLENRSEKFAA